jgi:argininosuccinate lyase
VAEHRDFASLSVAEWRAASDRFEPDIVQRITPGISVAAKRTPQSTAPAAVASRIADLRSWLDGLDKLC